MGVKNHCKGCIYSCLLWADWYSCDYIFKTGKRRPCPPGEGCTVKKMRKKRRAKREHRNSNLLDSCGVNRVGSVSSDVAVKQDKPD